MALKKIIAGKAILHFHKCHISQIYYVWPLDQT